MEKFLCIYHGNCDDGFAAAWVVREALGAENVEFFSGNYAFPPPDVSGRDVLMVDFSYKRPVLEKMILECRSMLVLDHHKTAQEDLAFLPVAPDSWNEYREVWLRHPPRPAYAKFDMERSGAGLAWDFFFAGAPRLLFIDYVEDRALWRKSKTDGDEFTIALRSYPQEFEVWDQLVVGGVPALIQDGRSIQRYYRLRVEELKRHAYLALLDGRRIWIANAPYAFASEVAGELAQGEGVDFGACYFEVAPDRWQYSLRSRGDLDVSKVAQRFGGGGHKGAAGFTVTSSEGGVHLPIVPSTSFK